MKSNLDDNFLLSDQDTNWFFGVSEDWTLDFFIKPLETLQVELTRTHRNLLILNLRKCPFRS